MKGLVCGVRANNHFWNVCQNIVAFWSRYLMRLNVLCIISAYMWVEGFSTADCLWRDNHFPSSWWAVRRCFLFLFARGRAFMILRKTNTMRHAQSNSSRLTFLMFFCLHFATTSMIKNRFIHSSPQRTWWLWRDYKFNFFIFLRKSSKEIWCDFCYVDSFACYVATPFLTIETVQLRAFSDAECFATLIRGKIKLLKENQFQ